MRRVKRRIIRLITLIVLVAAGGVLALVFYPFLPEGLKDAVAIDRQNVEEFRGQMAEQFTPPTPERFPTTLSELGAATLTPGSEIPENVSRGTPSQSTLSDGAKTTIEPNTAAAPPTVDPEALYEQRIYLLKLINADRASFGLSAVAMGSNPAAQAHAEEMLEHSYLSHWGLDGLKPYMRYTLAGGMEAENASGVSSPPQAGVRYRTTSPEEQLNEIERGWMDSSGHRANILNPWHKKVNLGIACNRTTCAAVQQFEGDYIEFEEPPSLTSGVLSVAGTVSGGLEFSGIQVWYDRPPHQLTLGQLDRTRCYSVGEGPVAFLREPLPSGTDYLPDLAPFTWNECSSPYDVSPDTPRRSFAMPTKIRPGSSKAPWVTALSWEDVNGRFRVQADLSRIVGDHGPGVYTVLVWGEADEEDVVLTNYSIFVE